VVPRNTAYVNRLLLKSSDLSIVPFCGQFVGVVKAVEPPPQQNGSLTFIKDTRLYTKINSDAEKKKRDKRGDEAYSHHKKGLITEKADKSLIHGR
jgi:hypothetical protein